MRRRGMVRASLALYTTREDIAQLASAPRAIRTGATRLLADYRVDDRGNHRHRRFVPPTLFDIAASIDRRLGAREPRFSAASSTRERPLSAHPPRPSA